MDFEENIEKIVNVLKEKVGKKCVRFTLEDEKTTLLGNKISGMPYIPKDGEYPVNPKNGNKLHLLIQLNFETIPTLPDFPEKGILQIFIDSDDGYGLNWDDPTDQSSWVIKYYENVEEPMTEEEIAALMPEQPEDYILPFEKYGKEYTLVCEEDIMPPSANMYGFEEIFEKYCKDCITEDMMGDEFLGLDDEVCEMLFEALYAEGSRLGGYPDFTQSDPREYNEKIRDYELLLQIDTEGNGHDTYLMWGDCGIANFFISLEDLKKRDFSKVWYNWDCC